MSPVCECHGLPKTWRFDSRKRLGGYWRCTERERETARERYARNPDLKLQRNAQWFHHKYETDPVWRISRNVYRSRLHRLEARKRRHQRLEELRGEV